MKTIYVAEDEANLRKPIQAFLQKAGYEVLAFEDGDLLYETFQKAPADLVLLDVMMPGSSGFVICAKLRAISTVPIIMLTARDTEEDFLSGLSLGADDYLVKPFSPVKLVAKVNALFKRFKLEKAMVTPHPTEKSVQFGDLTLDWQQQAATCNGRALKITRTELEFLLHLTKHQKRAVSREELLSKIWGYNDEVETRVTDDTVKRIRKKLADGKSRVQIETVWGFGFKLVWDGESE